VVGTCHNQPLSHRITTNQNRKRHMSCAYMNNCTVRAAFLYWYEPRVRLIYWYVGSAGFQVSIEPDRPRAVYLGRSVEYDVAPAIKTRSTWHSETSLRRYASLLLEHTPVPIQIFPFSLNSDPFHRRAVGFVRSILFPSHGHTNHPRSLYGQ
jgi:hypothetical protein